MIVHILSAGLPLCGFSVGLPSAWPDGHRWSRYGEEATCPGCIKAAPPKTFDPTETVSDRPVSYLKVRPALVEATRGVRVWEETWKSYGTEVLSETGGPIAEFWSGKNVTYGVNDARARLAGQVPGMASLLLDMVRNGELAPDREARARVLLGSAGVL